VFCITVQIIDSLSTHLNQRGVIGYTARALQQGVEKEQRSCSSLYGFVKVWCSI